MLSFTRAMFIHGSNFHEIISKFDHQFQRRKYFKDCLRISSCSYSARSPQSSKPCLWMDQNFANIFEKGHPRNIPVKLFQNRTRGFREDFLRISSCLYSAKSLPPSWQLCFF